MSNGSNCAVASDQIVSARNVTKQPTAMHAALADSISFVALALAAMSLAAMSGSAMAQSAEPTPAQNTAPAETVPQLPPVTVESDEQPNTEAGPQPKPAAENATLPPKVAAKPKRVATSPPKPAPAAPVETFEPVEATSAVQAEPMTTSTTGQGRGGPSGVDGYQATRSSSATKTDTPLRDVPQSATVVTKELVKDQGSKDLNSALRYVPGIHVQQGEGHRDAITIRGQTTTADFYTDGVRDDVQYFRDIYNIDVIEVLKGPNAMIFGRGGGGGIVNRVTKKAEFESIREGAVTFGSFDTKRATVDVGAALTQDFAVRVNGVYENSGGFRDFYELERYGFNPTVTANLSDATRLRVSYEYFSDNRTVDRGVPAFRGSGPTGTEASPLRPSRPARSTFFGDPSLSYSEFEGHIVTATIDHKFDNGLHLRNHTSYGDYDKFYANAFANGSATGPAGAEQVAIAAYYNDTDRQSFFNQTDLTARLDHGDGIRHTIVVGTEIGRQDTLQFRYDARFSPGNTTSVNVPFANPTTKLSNFTFSALQNNAINDTQLTTASAYIQDQLEITKYFQIIGGLRFERFDLDYTNQFDGSQFSRVDEEVSPRLGFVFKPIEPVSIYLSHSKSFLPYSGDQFASLTASTASLSPEAFINNEFGFKWDVLPRLALTGALYQLDRENTLVTVGPGVSEQVGLTRTEGGELALTGYMTDVWQMSVGYGYQDAVIVDAGTSSTTGNLVPMVPKHIFSMWNRYQFTDWFGAGLGVIHSTEFFPSADNTVVVPGYTRLDAALFVKLDDQWQAQLNVENVLDDTYFISAHNNNNISYGSPRAFYLTVTNKF